MNEEIERERADAIVKMMQSFTKHAADESKSFVERLEAAHMVRGFSQDHIIADLSSKGLMQDGDFKKKLLNSAEKLDRHDREA